LSSAPQPVPPVAPESAAGRVKLKAEDVAELDAQVRAQPEIKKKTVNHRTSPKSVRFAPIFAPSAGNRAPKECEI